MVGPSFRCLGEHRGPRAMIYGAPLRDIRSAGLRTPRWPRLMTWV